MICCTSWYELCMKLLPSKHAEQVYLLRVQKRIDDYAIACAAWQRAAATLSLHRGIFSILRRARHFPSPLHCLLRSKRKGG